MTLVIREESILEAIEDLIEYLYNKQMYGTGRWVKRDRHATKHIQHHKLATIANSNQQLFHYHDRSISINTFSGLYIVIRWVRSSLRVILKDGNKQITVGVRVNLHENKLSYYEAHKHEFPKVVISFENKVNTMRDGKWQVVKKLRAFASHQFETAHHDNIPSIAQNLCSARHLGEALVVFASDYIDKMEGLYLTTSRNNHPKDVDWRNVWVDGRGSNTLQYHNTKRSTSIVVYLVRNGRSKKVIFEYDPETERWSTPDGNYLFTYNIRANRLTQQILTTQSYYRTTFDRQVLPQQNRTARRCFVDLLALFKELRRRKIAVQQ